MLKGLKARSVLKDHQPLAMYHTTGWFATISGSSQVSPRFSLAKSMGHNSAYNGKIYPVLDEPCHNITSKSWRARDPE